MLIKNGTIHNAIEKEAFVADILIEGGKIKAIGTNLSAPEGDEVLDAAGKQIYPGFVEAHCHIGLTGRHGQGTGTGDHNERNDPVTPHLRAIDGVDPFDALRAITICPAEHIGIADRVGSLEVGKDADIVIANGSPFEISTVIETVLIDGKVVVG